MEVIRTFGFFCKKPKIEGIDSKFFVFKKFNLKKCLLIFLKNNIAYDIENYRKAQPGVRIWNGSNIKNDLIALKIGQIGVLIILSDNVKNQLLPEDLETACLSWR